MVAKRALWLEPPADFFEERRRKGLDQRDETWDGLVHMVPPPAYEHSVIQNGLQFVLTLFLEQRGLGKVRPEIGVRAPGSGTSNYRVPDISVLSPRRRGLVAEGWLNGGPELAIEIRSPDDETYDKLPFYASVGVDELLVIDRATRRPELYRLVGKQYVAVSPEQEGWLPLDTFPIAVRLSPTGDLELQLRLRADREVRSVAID